jgi:hypothetical protein
MGDRIHLELYSEGVVYVTHVQLDTVQRDNALYSGRISTFPWRGPLQRLGERISTSGNLNRLVRCDNHVHRHVFCTNRDLARIQNLLSKRQTDWRNNVGLWGTGDDRCSYCSPKRGLECPRAEARDEYEERKRS